MEATDGGLGADASLRQRYWAVRERIARAARAAGRDAREVGLLAVSKTFGAEQVLALAALGQRAFGENYVQEALAKMIRCDALAPGSGSGPPGSVMRLEWHYIGPIQSNKTRAIAEHFDWVHSVDRERIARRLSEQRPPALEPLQVCIQVNVSGEASKSGCHPQQVLELARAIVAMPRLRLRGLMAIPEPTGDPELQHARFAALAALARQLDAQGLGTTRLDTLSMGMSDDLEAAIAEGATLVRVGTAIFGPRERRATAEP